MLRLAFDFIITWRETRTRPNAYGHRLQPGERYSARTMTKRQADALLRKDLRKFCAMFQQFGKDSLLLATLAYNVGYVSEYIM